jgi:hypothetical protein
LTKDWAYKAALEFIQSSAELRVSPGWRTEARLASLFRAAFRRGCRTIAKNCPQCGQPYNKRACGPTHALVWNAIRGAVTRRRKALRK